MKLFQQNNAFDNEIFHSIRDGAIIIFPTETIYGIGCSSLQDKAINRVLGIKGRPANQPPPILINNEKQLQQLICDAPRYADELIKQFWPGSLTIIFNARDEVFDLLCGINSATNERTIAVRMTAHPIAQMLCERSEVPLIATSANFSGATGRAASPQTLDDIPDEFKEKVDVVIDGGEVGGTPSTIVDCTGSAPRIVRSGAVDLKL